ncbi:MAG TPA: prolipoprotein diacylglyceryl transferase family protein [Oscillospiraceae bacterium]|nr:prolipoprotein diacylglyceryl transferase family protein [Oscillospiraceae bacterium]
MHPFIHLFGKDIPTYSAMMLVAALLSSLLLFLRRKRYDIATDDTLYLVLFCVIGAIVGGKLLSIITIIPTLVAAWESIDNHLSVIYELFAGSGLVFYGGFIGAIGMAVIYTRKYKVSLLTASDYFAPAIGLAHGIGRIGCFLAGCCYGIPHEHGIAFTHSLGAPNGIKLLPIQLIESGLCLLLCAVMLILERFKFYRGRGLAIYILMYAPIRFTLEFFRGDLVRGVVQGISTSQVISILLFISAVLFIVISSKRRKPSDCALTGIDTEASS